MTQFRYDVFISYVRDEAKAFVENLAQQLNKEGITTWYDKNISATSKDWREEIDQAIDDSRVLVVVMTAKANRSRYVTYEWAYAWAKGKPLIILERQKLRSIHERLMTAQRALYTDANANFEQLKTTIQNALKAFQHEPHPSHVQLINALVELRFGEHLSSGDLFTFSQYEALTADDISEVERRVRELQTKRKT